MIRHPGPSVTDRSFPAARAAAHGVRGGTDPPRHQEGQAAHGGDQQTEADAAADRARRGRVARGARTVRRAGPRKAVGRATRGGRPSVVEASAFLAGGRDEPASPPGESGVRGTCTDVLHGPVGPAPSRRANPDRALRPRPRRPAGRPARPCGGPPAARHQVTRVRRRQRTRVTYSAGVRERRGREQGGAGISSGAPPRCGRARRGCPEPRSGPRRPCPARFPPVRPRCPRGPPPRSRAPAGRPPPA